MLSLRRLLALFFVFAIGLSLPVQAQVGHPVTPKLVVTLVIDQFNYDYLNRYYDKFGEGGFRYLLDNGANFVNCRYKQASTVTAVGHSVIATGAHPWSTGIIGNEWFDRRKNKVAAAISDESVQLVGANGPGASAKSMSGTTFGDEMKLATNGRSKVYSLSLKDRGAVFMAGRLGNSALWFDEKTGNFVSSSQYGSTLPGWVRTFNDSHYADKFFGKPWQRLLPESAYGASTRDDYTYEGKFEGDGKQFPHVITGGASTPNEAYYSAFESTPWANQMLLDLAREAVEHENLGQHTDPDCLNISFSATDLLGHDFGPYSQEVQDMMLRLDQSLATFLQYLDQKVGLNKTLIVLTGDHGSMPIPEFMREKGLDAGRIDPKSFRQLLDAAMDTRLGADDWIAGFTPPNLYLNLDAIDRQKYRQPDVEALAAKIAHSISGVGDVFTAYQFYMNQLPARPTAGAVKLNYNLARSGELYVVTKPGYVFIDQPHGTSHGSPYSYDAQVPLVLCGAGVKGGRYGQEASPADIAPTVCSLLNIAQPSLSEGRVLWEAMAALPGPGRPQSLPGAASGARQAEAK